MTATVRRATVADLPQLLALLARYYAEWDIWQRDDELTVRAAIEHPSLGYFIAEDESDATLAGCVQTRLLPSIVSAAECKRLFVSPQSRERGIASQLMAAAEFAVIAAGFQWLYLDSKAEFATAIALYRRRDYQDCPRFNDNAQATVFLRKHLNETQPIDG